jgi:hypothetical protein
MSYTLFVIPVSPIAEKNQVKMHFNNTFETNYQQMQACHIEVKMFTLKKQKHIEFHLFIITQHGTPYFNDNKMSYFTACR